MSSCTTYPSDEHIAKESLIVHTTRCLWAIKAQVRLLALPAERFSHTPFIVCMVTTGAIPLLSACRTIFSGKELSVGRNQLRLIIGCLKALAETWPRVAKYVREIQELARILLAVSTSSTPTPVPVPGMGQGTAVGSGVALSSQNDQPPVCQASFAHSVGTTSDANNELLSADILAAISFMPMIGAGWDLNDSPPGISPWWPDY